MQSRFTDIEQFLYALRNAGSKYSLDRISAFCDSLENPQNNFPKIHVAGTNGKGSVCAMLEAILRYSGLKTGMFTSPHLTYIGERVQVNRLPISKESLMSFVDKLKSKADSIFGDCDLSTYPSFFEFMTALAFLQFDKEKVDCAVVEVGLGGTLDSTNIITPEISVITSIGLDHIQMLGATIEEIAREKAGIIKKGVPVVCGFLPEAAMSVIAKIAKEKSASLFKVEDYFSDATLPTTSLFGYYQRRNAATALLCTRILRERAKNGEGAETFSKLTEENVISALQEVSWDARWQTIKMQNGSTLILDSSHNEEGAKTLEKNLSEFCSGEKKPIITVGVLGEDRAIPLLEVAKKYAKKIVLLVPNQPRALEFESLLRCLGDCDIPVEMGKVSKIFKSKNICTITNPNDTVISTGSIYLAGEILSAISGKESDSLQDIPYK